MLLLLNHIYKTYVQGKMEVPVLKDISLAVNEGEYVAIMGPSGSGKTTLMNIIGCLDYPTKGEYLLENDDVFKYSDSELSDLRLNSIGFVFQNFHLLPRQSALENVALPLIYAGIKKPQRQSIAAAALERVGLADRVNFKPTQLSGGQCQRVAIARAMVNNPKILLADEPTGALDMASGEQIMELFEKLHSEGVTIVMITHEQAVADHAQKVYHIVDGRFSNQHGYHVLSSHQEDVTPYANIDAGGINSEESFIDEEVSSVTVSARKDEPPRKAVPEKKDKPVPEYPAKEAVPAEKNKAVYKEAKVKKEPQDNSGRHIKTKAKRVRNNKRKKADNAAESGRQEAIETSSRRERLSDTKQGNLSYKAVSHGQFKNPIKTEIQIKPPLSDNRREES